MNMKTIIAAFAVAAATVASAGTFKWLMSDNYWGGKASDADGYSRNDLDHFRAAPGVNRYEFVTDTSKWNWGAGTQMQKLTNDGWKYGFTYDSDKAWTDYYGQNYSLVIKLGGNGIGATADNTAISGAVYAGYYVRVDDLFDALAKTGSFTLKDKNNHVIGTFTGVAPEPTSGLMLLLGAGMLALRRKHAKAA